LVERSSGTLTIEWSAPSSDGGAQIEFYMVYFKTEDEVDEHYIEVPQLDGEVRTATLENLENGKIYQISVRAVNYAGQSKDAGFVEFGVGAVPEAPQNVRTITTHSGEQVVVSWGEPGYNGGFEVSGYTVALWEPNQEKWVVATSYCSESEGFEMIPHSPCTFDVKTLLGETDTHRGAAVKAKIVAKNEIGHSEEASGEGAYLPTFPDAPSAPTIFERGNGFLVLNWNKGEFNGHNSISQYTITVIETTSNRVVDVVLLTADLSQDGFAQRLITIEDLDNGKEYTFEVTSSNIAGSSAKSSAKFIVGTEPAAPRSVKTTRSDDATEVVISWKNAASVGILRVTGNSVFVKDSNNVFLDATDLCKEGDDAYKSQKCTLAMSTLGKRPFNLD